VDGATLYVADTENHVVRAIDRKTKQQKVIAGTGVIGRDNGALASPWDLARIGRTLYIANAGTHQILALDLDKGTLAVAAGSTSGLLRLEHELDPAAMHARHLVIPQFDTSNCGTYTVKVFNHAESVTSLPSQLNLAPPATGGGQVYFANRRFILEAPADAPVFDTDGVTPLSGPSFQARLYIGSTPESLRAAAEPLPFLSGFSAGFFDMKLVTLPQIPAGTQVYAQVRAWEATQGASFEEVRAMGGRLGASAVLPIVTAGGTWPAPTDGFLNGLQSFSLQYGLPEYRRGLLRFVTQGTDGVFTWELIGQPGGRYIIERQVDGANWLPLTTLTNPGGRITFTDTPPAEAVSTLYRAQLLQ
ncbi:MAG TPA: hypothetical protein VJA21_14130, partial [Verrucomicrobiae bacterium]